MAKKYAIHPGWIRSKSDGDEHYVGIAQLASLYELSPSEYVVWTDHDNRGRTWRDYVHLYPSYEGNYGRPKDA
jgi:hypothetical protein